MDGISSYHQNWFNNLTLSSYDADTKKKSYDACYFYLRSFITLFMKKITYNSSLLVDLECVWHIYWECIS